MVLVQFFFQFSEKQLAHPATFSVIIVKTISIFPCCHGIQSVKETQTVRRNSFLRGGGGKSLGEGAGK